MGSEGEMTRQIDQSVNPDNLLANVAAGQYAREVAAMCADQSQRFWESLKLQCEARLPQPEPEPDLHPPMSEQEAIRFEAVCVPYGKHIGQEIGIVPCDYLLFLAEGDKFNNQVKRYVKSGRFQKRQDEESTT